MITGPEPGQTDAPLTIALAVFRTAFVSFAREVANWDERVATNAFEVANAAVEARLGGGPGGSEASDVTGREAAMRNAIRIQLRKVMAAAKAAIDEQVDGSDIDAGGW